VLHPLCLGSSILEDENISVETSGAKYFVLHPLCLDSSTLEDENISVETSGTKYFVMHPLCLDSSTLEDEKCRNVGNQIFCDASSLLGQFDP